MHGVFHVVFGYVFHVCDCLIVCYTLRGYYAGKLCAWHNVYRKKLEAKVRNHNLRGSENEMNLKVLNFIEINKMSGWQVAPLRR